MEHSTKAHKLKRAAEVVCKQGMVQFPVSDTAIAIIDRVVGDSEEELALIYAFRKKPSQTMGQLEESSEFSTEKIEQLATSLARKGLIFNQPSSSGVMIYRLLPLILVGVMEYKFMVALTGSEEEKELAGLFEKLLEELRDEIQDNFDTLSPLFNSAPAVDRTVPTRQTEDGKPVKIISVDKALGVSEEFVLPSQTVEEIINKFDDIAVGYCFCRQRRSLLGDNCRTDAPTLNCFTFGKSARHTAAQGFAKDCCDTLNLWRNGTLPLINSTYHLSVIDRDTCTGCGICIEWCPTDAIVLDDEGLALRDENACFGCGVCSRFCPEEGISLKEGLRRVFIMPPRLRTAE